MQPRTHVYTVTHRYPWRSLIRDDLRAVAGVACTGLPLMLSSPPGVVSVVLAALMAIFIVFGVQAALRHVTTILVDGHGIRALPLGIHLDWQRLSRLRLVYYSVRRDGRGGWMELVLGSGGRRLRVDSRLEGFAEVVRQAAAAADRAGLDLEPSTTSNLDALGIGTGASSDPL